MKVRFKIKKNLKPKPFDKNDPDTWPMAERQPPEPEHIHEDRYKEIRYDYTGRYEIDTPKKRNPNNIGQITHTTFNYSEDQKTGLKYKNNKKGRALEAKKAAKEAKIAADQERSHAKYIKAQYTGRYDLTDEYDEERKSREARKYIIAFFVILTIIIYFIIQAYKNRPHDTLEKNSHMAYNEIVQESRKLLEPAAGQPKVSKRVAP